MPATDPTPTPTALDAAHEGFWAQPWSAADSQALVSEAVNAWSCAFGAWGAYLTRLSLATGPAAVLEANTQFMTDSLDVCTRAAAARLREAGLKAPLLSDA
jgi:hypothetical protein